MAPTTAWVSVDKASGPPSAAPTPMSLASGVLPKTTATSVTTLSGSAVPNAASTVPTAVCEMPKRWPTHSTPLTKYAQAR